MADFKNVCIGIQARSTSTRLPRKVFELIGEKPLLQHVIDACERAKIYMNRHSHKSNMIATVALLIPHGDEIKQVFRNKGAIIVEGAEHDVLSRYKFMAERLKADYIVRVTGDCPLIPSYVITKHVKAALMNEYDYTSNVDEDLRTSADGTDCEVISKRLLDWLDENAKDPKDREHVTLLARRAPPAWCKTGHVIGFLNLASLNLSVNTHEDLERVRAEYKTLSEALKKAERKHGRESIHRF